MKKNYDVIIVGAGPVGLWLACELKLAGVDVLVIERRIERSQKSKALTIHGRTLEVFALRGLAERFLQAGKRVLTGHYGVLDTRLDFSPFETRFPYTLFLPQAVTEERIEERALEFGVDILRGWNVTRVEDMGDHVRLSTEVAEFTAAYVVGADGARSLVRKQAWIAFEGIDARNTFMMADVILGAPPSRQIVSVVNEHGLVMIAPLGDGVHHRIVIVDPTRIDVARTEPMTLEEIAGPTARITGEDYLPRDPIWLSRFTDETKLAASYRKGRFLLAGDAAHIHAPVGGQGMNIGLQDAMNLGWKLAAVVKGRAPEVLLDSYEEERREVGQRLCARSLAQLVLITRFDAATLALRNTLSDLLTIPEVNRRFAGEMSGFDVIYGAKTNLAVGQLSVGTRVPDVDLILAEGEVASLYSLLHKGNWLHLIFDSRAEITRPPWLSPHSVYEVTANVLSDHAAFSGISALLIRPDGYVASVALDVSLEILRNSISPAYAVEKG